MRYRIALCGFSEFEFRAMLFSFGHPDGKTVSAYDVVVDPAEADFAVVDADSQAAVKRVIGAGMLKRAIFIGDRPPSEALWRLPRPIDPSRILRILDEITVGQTVPSAFRDAPVERVFPTLEDVIDGQPEPDDRVLGVAPPATNAPAAASSDLSPGMAATDPAEAARARRALQSLAKAAARAAARRARLASARVANGQAEPLRDVLVLDADRSANLRLCELLERFGFEPHPVYAIADAEAQLVRRPYAAVFLDIALDGLGGDLLRQIRSLPPAGDHPGPAVFMVAATADPAEQVRAALAGVAAPLVKPLSRGAVARALESVGVVLPADARRL